MSNELEESKLCGCIIAKALSMFLDEHEGIVVKLDLPFDTEDETNSFFVYNENNAISLCPITDESDDNLKNANDGDILSFSGEPESEPENKEVESI
jgi:uncharacterized protein YacL (UPF0231 family)